ncbi:MAG TPA: gamma-glutamyl-gamma-aminobutyrate hydrolase family protein [Limnochordia bacterium]|nr:gamma-glutamyl-gamma-aminobutyrate hydrolase family protein [Limnochordia bacterium]
MQQDKPMIGLLCAHEQEKRDQYFVVNTYIQAVIKAGGIPILIPYQPKEQIFRILEGLDGLVLPGGDDVDPSRYGENPIIQCGAIDPHWDDLDLWAAGFALDSNMPILAICRGCQVLNVALGGTLVQDIPTQIKDPLKHAQQAPRWYASHDITVQSASLLGNIWEHDPKKVNSYHHQSIAKVGKGLRIVASAPDGVIEAVESTEHRFVLGLQWHPELMTDHYPVAGRLFKHFIQAASQS